MRARLGARALSILVVAMSATMTANVNRTVDAESKFDQGKALFHAKCGYCHLAGGTGTIMLGRRLGKDRALLEDRIDLSADYIRHVARAGIGSMPRETRVELPDSELDSIAAYLTRPASVRGPAK